MDRKLHHLRLKGNQFQFRMKVPEDVVGVLQRDWVHKNLKTGDVNNARKMRDRLLVETRELFDRARRKAKGDDAEGYLEHIEYLSSLDGEARGVLEGVLQEQAAARFGLKEDEEPSAGAKAWFKMMLGEEVPIHLNVVQFLKEAPAVDTTQKARQATIDRFISWMKANGHEPIVSHVNKRLAGRFTSALIEEGLASKTVSTLLSFLSSYWSWMESRGLVESNPFKGQRVASKAKRGEQGREAWEPEEAVRLIDRAPSRLLRHAIAIAALSGMRAGEIVALKVSDCADGCFRVRQGKSQAAKRLVPIHSQLTAIIAARVAGKSPEAYLIEELDDTVAKAKGLVNRFARYRKSLFGSQAGQAKKVFHSLRHMFITERRRAACDLYVVEAVVGHKSKGIAVIAYHHGYSVPQLRAVVEAVSLPDLPS